MIARDSNASKKFYRTVIKWSKGSFPESNEKCSLLGERRTNDVYGYGGYGSLAKEKETDVLSVSDSSYPPF